MVEILLQAGADLRAVSNNGSTVLLMAVQSGHSKMCRYLIKRGADVTAKHNKKGGGALHKACSSSSSSKKQQRNNSSSMDMAAMLIAAGADVNDTAAKDGSTPIHVAVQHKHHDIMLLLMEKGAVVDAAKGDGTTALHLSLIHI